MSKTALPAFLMMLFACSNATPSGFWAHFKKEFQQKSINDQGPYGGHRAMYWKSNKGSAFDTDEIIEFAKQNGWVLVDSLEYPSGNSKTEHSNNVPDSSHAMTQHEISMYEKFPRWIKSNTKIYRFKTGWVTIEPGTDNSTDINGFVILGNENTEMEIYHVWGE
ncbi:hypothetical protein [Chryseolinea lacunae]|uniref:Uncharacterized protein n=1 Tax=Chryseolinea lacunae TaxID=2801331 RepID=A0ABS1L1A2_9BACT|nr:hypothetical protein [Chryseolinea lacunae]MBL0745228.1 hypothetical protein [Chryseolinea lacunae]